MATIRMTEEETRTYDEGAFDDQVELMRALRVKARVLMAESGDPVEVTTADGIVVYVAQ